MGLDLLKALTPAAIFFAGRYGLGNRSWKPERGMVKRIEAHKRMCEADQLGCGGLADMVKPGVTVRFVD